MKQFVKKYLWYLLGAFVFFCALAIVGLKILSSELDERFYASYDSVPTRVYSSVYWLKPGVSASPEEIRFRLKERDYHDVGTLASVAGKGSYAIELNENGELKTLKVSTREFNYPQAAIEGLFQNQTVGVVPSKYTVLFNGGWVEKVFNDKNEEILGVAFEPTLVAQLNEAGGQARKTIQLGEIPHTLIKAIVLIEDQRFLEHSGVDPRGILRSIYVNARSGAMVQGASTITQQLAKNIYLNRQRTISRKLKEVVMSILLELKFTKDQIMEKYLNEVYFGQSGNIAVHGVAEAAKFYFGKSLDDLSIAEQAFLAGLVRGPFYYSPFRHFERAKGRQEIVLSKMLEAGVITDNQYKQAVAEKVRFEKASPVQNRAPYFTDMIQAQIFKDLPEQEIAGSGYTIFSTLDTYYQEIAEKSVAEGVTSLEDRLKQYLAKKKTEDEIRLIQGSFICVDPATAYLRCIVGGRSYEESSYNRALLMRRHIGSLIKPFVYLSALMYGRNADGTPMSAISKFEDKEFTYEFDDKKWSPKNYEEEFEGTVTMRFALANSINTVAAQIAVQTGLDKLVDVARLAGITTDIKPYPSLSLGAVELPPLEVATAYATLANFGIRKEITSTLLVVAEDGKVIAKFLPKEEQALPPEETANLVNLMTSVFDIGTAKAARPMGFVWPAAGKTGTTNEFRDAWFAGFTNKTLAISWVGFDRDDENVRKQRKALKLTGAVAALPTWVSYMKTVHKSQVPHGLAYPDGTLRTIKVDLITGGRANYNCMGNNAQEEVFTAKNIPMFECN